MPRLRETGYQPESGYLPEPDRTRRSARDRIIRAATRLFYQQGIRAVSVDTVVEESGVAKTTLYKHFRSKDDLVATCLLSLDERYFRWFELEVERRASDPLEQLLAMFDVYDDWFQRPDFRGCAFINATIELAQPEHPAREPILRHKRRCRELIERLARDAGLPSPSTVSADLTLLMEGAIVTALVEHDWSAAQRAREAATRLL